MSEENGDEEVKAPLSTIETTTEEVEQQQQQQQPRSYTSGTETPPRQIQTSMLSLTENVDEILDEQKNTPLSSGATQAPAANAFIHGEQTPPAGIITIDNANDDVINNVEVKLLPQPSSSYLQQQQQFETASRSSQRSGSSSGNRNKNKKKSSSRKGKSSYSARASSDLSITSSLYSVASGLIATGQPTNEDLEGLIVGTNLEEDSVTSAITTQRGFRSAVARNRNSNNSGVIDTSSSRRIIDGTTDELGTSSSTHVTNNNRNKQQTQMNGGKNNNNSNDINVAMTDLKQHLDKTLIEIRDQSRRDFEKVLTVLQQESIKRTALEGRLHSQLLMQSETMVAMELKLLRLEAKVERKEVEQQRLLQQQSQLLQIQSQQQQQSQQSQLQQQQQQSQSQQLHQQQQQQSQQSQQQQQLQQQRGISTQQPQRGRYNPQLGNMGSTFRTIDEHEIHEIDSIQVVHNSGPGGQQRLPPPPPPTRQINANNSNQLHQPVGPPGAGPSNIAVISSGASLASGVTEELSILRDEDEDDDINSEPAIRGSGDDDDEDDGGDDGDIEDEGDGNTYDDINTASIGPHEVHIDDTLGDSDSTPTQSSRHNPYPLVGGSVGTGGGGGLEAILLNPMLGETTEMGMSTRATRGDNDGNSSLGTSVTNVTNSTLTSTVVTATTRGDTSTVNVQPRTGGSSSVNRGRGGGGGGGNDGASTGPITDVVLEENNTSDGGGGVGNGGGDGDDGHRRDSMGSDGNMIGFATGTSNTQIDRTQSPLTVQSAATAPSQADMPSVTSASIGTSILSTAAVAPPRSFGSRRAYAAAVASASTNNNNNSNAVVSSAVGGGDSRPLANRVVSFTTDILQNPPPEYSEAGDSITMPDELDNLSEVADTFASSARLWREEYEQRLDALVKRWQE